MRKERFERDRDKRKKGESDYHDYFKSARREERQKRRHNINHKMKDIISGHLSPEEIEDFEEYYENDE